MQQQGWEPPRRVDLPEPGFFELKLVRGGPMVGARIVFEDGLWCAWIDGKPQSAPHPDAAMARDVYRIWHSGHRISEDIYRFRLAFKDWASSHDPTHPVMRPAQVIDLAQRRSLF